MVVFQASQIVQGLRDKHLLGNNQDSCAETARQKSSSSLSLAQSATDTDGATVLPAVHVTDRSEQPVQAGREVAAAAACCK
jgi:hypothetical protein